MPDATLTRGHKKKARTRRLLIDAAVDVIATRGEGFSISDVANQAGVSNGTFYNYFTDRDELIEAVVPEVIATFAAARADEVALDDPAARFATVSAMALAHAAARPDQLRVLLRLEAGQRSIADGRATAFLREDLVLGADSGRFLIASEPATVDVVLGALLMAARRIADGGTDDGYRGEVVAQLLRSLGIDASEAAALAVAAVAAAPTDQP